MDFDCVFTLVYLISSLLVGQLATSGAYRSSYDLGMASCNDRFHALLLACVDYELWGWFARGWGWRLIFPTVVLLENGLVFMSEALQRLCWV